MKRLRAWILRLTGVLPSERRQREMAEEIESHVQMQTEDNLRSGMTPEQARREAILKLGGWNRRSRPTVSEAPSLTSRPSCRICVLRSGSTRRIRDSPARRS